MKLPAKIIKLPENILQIIRDFIPQAPKTGLEILLTISSGSKIGDVIDILNYQQIGKLTIKTIKLLKELKANIDYRIINKSNTLEELIFFNPLLINQELLEKVTNTIYSSTSNDEIIGQFYSFPQCCINAYLKNNGTTTHPYTEHVWCKTNCKKSIRLGNIYHKTVIKNIPEYEYLIYKFNKLRNGLPQLTMLWNEMYNRRKNNYN